MPDTQIALIDRLIRFPPFDLLPEIRQAELAGALGQVSVDAGTLIVEEGTPLAGLYVIETGMVELRTRNDHVISHRGPGDVIGERGLLRDGRATLTARAKESARLIVIPSGQFRALFDQVPEIAAWFGRGLPSEPGGDEGPYAVGLTALQVADMMVRQPVTCAGDTTVTDVARIMRDRAISSVLVTEGGQLSGIVTVHDLTNKILAEGLTGDRPVNTVMTPGPRTISPDATGLDALIEMAQHRINHLPVADARGNLVGMIGKTDLFRQQAATASHMVAEIVGAGSAAEMAQIMTRLPELLTYLVAAGVRPNAIGRRITDLTDAITRRLLSLAEDRLGLPPVPFLWAACGSQGRREQSGISDQDNCLILDDGATPEHGAYFAELARLVSSGLDEIGFFFCPGDMMATNPRWRQPRRVWQRYFSGWIAEPDTEAQMLASVMFDLRPISGDKTLFSDLQRETLQMAQRNSIFVSHMVSNALKHAPPLNLFRGFALIRSGEHKNTLDLKLAGVVPIIDLGRIYALIGGIEAVNTRERIAAAGEAGVISQSGARDLTDAYDLIAQVRLNHQAAMIAENRKPDNFLAPGHLSELERNHLRDAFLVVKTMQAALGHGRMGMG